MVVIISLDERVSSIEAPVQKTELSSPILDAINSLRPHATPSNILALGFGGMSLFNLGVIIFLDDQRDVVKGPVHTDVEMLDINKREPWRANIPLHHWPIGIILISVSLAIMFIAILLWLINGGVL